MANGVRICHTIRHRSPRTHGRRRTLIVYAGAALAAGLAGCTTAASTTSVSGGTLSIFLSQPPGTSSPEQQDVIKAERLAFQQAGAHVGKYTVRLVQFDGKELSDNARQAIGDDTTIAYLGELAPGASQDTLGITNAQNVLQVTPTDTAVEQTQHSPAVASSPDRYYESLSGNGRTFARVVPTTALEARALVGQMQSVGVRHLFIRSDGSAYGAALAYAVKTSASAASGTPSATSTSASTSKTTPSAAITPVSSAAAADGILFAEDDAAGAAQAFDQAAATTPHIKLFGPSALAKNSFAATLSPAAQRVTYVTQPGFGPGNPPPALGRQFASTFKATYGHAPSPQAVFGYEAMAAVMSVLHEAGDSAGNRNTVVKDFFLIRNRVSPLGTYTINQNGDTSTAPFLISRVRAGMLVPYRAVSEQ
jgi:branched-chain amino acid transport system substrate-binding protein